MCIGSCERDEADVTGVELEEAERDDGKRPTSLNNI